MQGDPCFPRLHLVQDNSDDRKVSVKSKQLGFGGAKATACQTPREVDDSRSLKRSNCQWFSCEVRNGKTNNFLVNFRLAGCHSFVGKPLTKKRLNGRRTTSHRSGLRQSFDQDGRVDCRQPDLVNGDNPRSDPTQNPARLKSDFET